MRYPKLAWATSVCALIGLAACGAPKQPDVAESRNDAAAPLVASPDVDAAPQTAAPVNVATAAAAPQPAARQQLAEGVQYAHVTSDQLKETVKEEDKLGKDDGADLASLMAQLSGVQNVD